MTYRPVDVVEVRAWGRRVGALAAGARRAYQFEYAPEWIRTGIELNPMLPLAARRTYSFPDLDEQTFKLLPPMIADALPDRFGNAIVTEYLAREGIAVDEITPLDRLAYVGSRGMGALEFVPDLEPAMPRASALDLNELVSAARSAVTGSFSSEPESTRALLNIMQVGISAGGARPKAIVNLDEATGEVRSGHAPPEPGFSPWLLKFDGVIRDTELGSSRDYGRIEYAYARMAVEAGIDMPETRLLEEGGRAHFMTRRFDRSGGGRTHLQSLCGLDAVDFNLRHANGYEQVFTRIIAFGLGEDALREQFRRMAFNVAAANMDDHSKNVSFLMDEGGPWRLSPGYDITHAHNPRGEWTREHLMSVNGRFSEIRRDDLLQVADRFGVPDARTIVDEVLHAVDDWPHHARLAGVSAEETQRIRADIVAQSAPLAGRGRRPSTRA